MRFCANTVQSRWNFFLALSLTSPEVLPAGDPATERDVPQGHSMLALGQGRKPALKEP